MKTTIALHIPLIVCLVRITTSALIQYKYERLATFPNLHNKPKLRIIYLSWKPKRNPLCHPDEDSPYAKLYSKLIDPSGADV